MKCLTNLFPTMKTSLQTMQGVWVAAVTPQCGVQVNLLLQFMFWTRRQIFYLKLFSRSNCHCIKIFHNTVLIIHIGHKFQILSCLFFSALEALNLRSALVCPLSSWSIIPRSLDEFVQSLMPSLQLASRSFLISYDLFVNIPFIYFPARKNHSHGLFNNVTFYRLLTPIL